MARGSPIKLRDFWCLTRHHKSGVLRFEVTRARFGSAERKIFTFDVNELAVTVERS